VLGIFSQTALLQLHFFFPGFFNFFGLGVAVGTLLVEVRVWWVGVAVVLVFAF
jgi:hypothetical protein